MIELDGSHEEGGGQILRTALALSILTQKAFRINNIRKNRPEPGLKAQHVACIKTAVEFSNAHVEGNKIGSDLIEFIPRTIKNRQIEVNIGTAGSTTLLLQSVLLPMMFTDCEIKITGGTDVKWSMPVDYLMNVLKPALSKFCTIDISLEKRGYYPKGEGKIIIKTKSKYKRIDFDSFEKFQQYIFGNPVINMTNKGKLMSIRGISHASKDLQENEVAERQAMSAELWLKKYCPVKVKSEYANTESTGSGVVLYAVYKYDNGKDDEQYYIGSDALGEKGIKSEEVGKQAAEKLSKAIDREERIDENLQDNIIPFLGLFGGRISVDKITGHTKSNIEVCEKFLNVKYEIENKNKSNYKDANLISVLSSSKP